MVDRDFLQMSISALKIKISTHCGTSPEDMQLSLRDERGKILVRLQEDQRLLGYYSPYDGYVRLPRVISFSREWLQGIETGTKAAYCTAYQQAQDRRSLGRNAYRYDIRDLGCG